MLQNILITRLMKYVRHIRIKNAAINKFPLFNDIVYLIYNYHLEVGISTKDYQVVFDYEAKDNIWKMALVNNQIIFTTQWQERWEVLIKTNGR